MYTTVLMSTTILLSTTVLISTVLMSTVLMSTTLIAPESTYQKLKLGSYFMFYKNIPWRILYDFDYKTIEIGKEFPEILAIKRSKNL